MFLSCSAKSHLLQNTSSANQTGLKNQVCTELCICRAAAFVHTLKEGMYELK